MIIAPSVLASDFTRLGKEVQRVNRSDAEWLHLDIMDGHFVPNISFGPAVVAALRPLSRLLFDVHLMCSQPEILLEPFARAGADQINIHVELGDQVRPLIWKIKSLGKKVGLVVNPPTSVMTVVPYLDQISELLIMTVHPGFGGQSFIHETLPKVQQACVWRKEKRLTFAIGVDGGVDFRTVAECSKAGADAFISGTALFRQHSMSAAVKKMRQIARKNAPAPGPRIHADLARVQA